jgi:hypothetical protein
MTEERDRRGTEPPAGAANDNGANAIAPVDPRILAIARAVGRLIAREQFKTANDNSPPGRGNK